MVSSWLASHKKRMLNHGYSLLKSWLLPVDLSCGMPGQAVDQKAISTEDLTRVFGWDGSEARVQHDVHELNRILFESVEFYLKGTQQESLVKDLYHGTLVNQVRHRCATPRSVTGRPSSVEPGPRVLTLIVVRLVEEVLAASFVSH